ncbi:hypothetical protein [Chitinilyticum aquatile]|uniref:hypothetical protein n=1 Tax=Chitinilyticum aquatile TaxID=362520 RepID=UPI0012DC02BF|nr:hypothetical protein [Chitinilyticum aquatile]
MRYLLIFDIHGYTPTTILNKWLQAYTCLIFHFLLSKHCRHGSRHSWAGPRSRALVAAHPAPSPFAQAASQCRSQSPYPHPAWNMPVIRKVQRHVGKQRTGFFTIGKAKIDAAQVGDVHPGQRPDARASKTPILHHGIRLIAEAAPEQLPLLFCLF